MTNSLPPLPLAPLVPLVRAPVPPTPTPLSTFRHLLAVLGQTQQPGQMQGIMPQATGTQQTGGYSQQGGTGEGGSSQQQTVKCDGIKSKENCFAMVMSLQPQGGDQGTGGYGQGTGGYTGQGGSYGQQQDGYSQGQQQGSGNYGQQGTPGMQGQGQTQGGRDETCNNLQPQQQAGQAYGQGTTQAGTGQAYGQGTTQAGTGQAMQQAGQQGRERRQPGGYGSQQGTGQTEQPSTEMCLWKVADNECAPIVEKS